MAPELKQRPLMRHNPLHTHVRSTRDELAEMGRLVGERLYNYPIQVRILIPEKGFTETGRPGGPIYDPESDRGFREGLEAFLVDEPNPNLVIETYPWNINEPEFAAAVVDAMKTVEKDEHEQL
ncbi:MAG: Tm-1-like ATP-binding domain-containing protein [Halomonas sp.]|uniref:Tm-1-like ATP-binding domain-containing protein n=1 Tax=Halomonas sp. TaxID=1486246 RepID=UPI002ACDF8EC|nr:Tm-1-like ATP-binding domain-containing protein [Halomonas sp.]MDZ7852649.1 Tm-1-like ATP-binding domain-containing protein [Halomonas sp.]